MRRSKVKLNNKKTTTKNKLDLLTLDGRYGERRSDDGHRAFDRPGLGSRVASFCLSVELVRRLEVPAPSFVLLKHQVSYLCLVL